MINKERKGKKEKQNEKNSITTMYSNYSDFNLEPKQKKFKEINAPTPLSL